jgi:hypothetical protein
LSIIPSTYNHCSAPPVVDAVAGGWMVSMIGFLQTGQFLTPAYSMPDPTGTVDTTSGNRPLVTIRPDYLRSAKLSNPSVGRWFDVSAFQPPPAGRFGNSAPGVIVGPGENMWHARHIQILRIHRNRSLAKTSGGDDGD